MKLILALIIFLQVFVGAARTEKLEYYIEMQLPASPKTSNLTYRLVLPTEIKNRQVVKLEYTVEPTRVFDDAGTRYAEWQLNDLSKGKKLGITIKAILYQADMSSLKRSSIRLSPQEHKKYTNPEKWIESDHAKVIEALGEIRANRVKKVMVENILKYVTKTMKYSGYNNNDIGAVKSLNQKHGDCSEYTDLFVALCRAKGIPARAISGVSTDWESNDTPKHVRAEVFLANYGWVPIDPLWSDIGSASFQKTPSFLQMSTKRTDSVLNYYYYWGYTYVGGNPKVKTTIKLVKNSNLRKLPALAEY